MPAEGRDLSSEPTRKAERDRRLGNLLTPESVKRLRTTLHAKAKDEPEFRFYALYDKIYRQDVLEHAYACCRANKGAAGVDGLTFEEVESYGRERWIGELAQQLREESYRPEAVRRVYMGASAPWSHPVQHQCHRKMAKATSSGREARRAHQSHYRAAAAECLNLYLDRNALDHGGYVGDDAHLPPTAV